MPTQFTLNHPAIDTLHKEMTTLLQAAITTPDSKLLNALTCLQLHCEHHFMQEESLMTQHHFAGYNEHRHEYSNCSRNSTAWSMPSSGFIFISPILTGCWYRS